MILTKKAFLALFAIIIIEGYVVLSSELLAIRVVVPFVGSGTDIVSIIIAAVLLPLSFGYYAGGQFKGAVRAKLVRNILISAGILTFGLSYAPLNSFMNHAIDAGLTSRLGLAGVYSLIFLVTPVFLLGQTIPLVSNYFSHAALSKVTGKILFLSTIGSFLGATFSTLVLMAWIGVNYTAALNIVLLAILYFLLTRRQAVVRNLLMLLFVVAAMLFNSNTLLTRMNVVEFNAYNVVKVFDMPGGDIRILSLNHNSDSAISRSGEYKHGYVKFIQDHYLFSRNLDEKPLQVLVIGAGGFTVGYGETMNTYHYVDIDPTLKDVAEKHFFEEPLAENQIFHPVSAETFLIEGTTKFDLVVLDAFQGDLTLPENLVTQEFFQRVKNRLADGGVVVANIIVNPAFGSALSRNLDHTFRQVFPLITRQVIGDFNGWDTDMPQNIVYIYKQNPNEGALKIYTDNKNSVYYDKPAKRQRHE